MAFNVNDLNIAKKENTLKNARNQTTLKPVDVFFCVSLRKEGMSQFKYKPFLLYIERSNQ